MDGVEVEANSAAIGPVMEGSERLLSVQSLQRSGIESQEVLDYGQGHVRALLAFGFRIFGALLAKKTSRSGDVLVTPESSATFLLPLSAGRCRLLPPTERKEPLLLDPLSASQAEGRRSESGLGLQNI